MIGVGQFGPLDLQRRLLCAVPLDHVGQDREPGPFPRERRLPPRGRLVLIVGGQGRQPFPLSADDFLPPDLGGPCATRATISRSRWLSGERSRSRGAACAATGPESSAATNWRITDRKSTRLN